MRLKEEEKKIIVQAIKSIDQNAEVYLFGSRVDDNRKGGDIDILVLSDKINFSDKLKIKRAIFAVLEEQKIDLLISKDANEPFVRLALQQGIKLA